MLIAGITYPGCKDWCRYTWGQTEKILKEIGFSDAWLKKRGIGPKLFEGDHQERKNRRDSMLNDMIELCKEKSVAFGDTLSFCDNKGGKMKQQVKSEVKSKKNRVKSEVKTEVKTEVKPEVKTEVKTEVKREKDHVKRRTKNATQRPKAASFGDHGPNGKFMGDPNRARMGLEIKHDAKLSSFKRSAEPSKTHEKGVMPGLDQADLADGVAFVRCAPPGPTP
jgi:hypothetical protein